jgi:phthalate 4,5-dioxygenase
MRAEQNELVTRVGPGTGCGELLRRYWQPVALLDEFNPEFDPAMAQRPVKAVRALGQDFVLFQDAQKRWGLIDRDCPHRGADLAFGRYEGDGLRCPFHGWKFGVDGTCLETPGEPIGSALCSKVRQMSYPLQQQAGVLWAWLGPKHLTPPSFPAFDCFKAPGTHSFAFKGLWHANWLQCVEVGIDPAHPSFLHRYFGDETLDQAYGRQFRGASAGDVDGERWPMTRIMRESFSPEIRFEAREWGYEITALRALNEKFTHVRVTQGLFPQGFVIPLSETITITQLHLPVDDTQTYWYSIFTSFDAPLDKATMRQQRLRGNPAPSYAPVMGRHNGWGYSPAEQRERTYLGMGEDDINVHDQWAVESMGPIADRTREHLGTTDKIIMANRRNLLQAIDTVKAGGTPWAVFSEAEAKRLIGPDTLDGIAPAGAWQPFWQHTAAAKRAKADWLVAMDMESQASRPAPPGAQSGQGNATLKAY